MYPSPKIFCLASLNGHDDCGCFIDVTLMSVNISSEGKSIPFAEEPMVILYFAFNCSWNLCSICVPTAFPSVTPKSDLFWIFDSAMQNALASAFSLSIVSFSFSLIPCILVYKFNHFSCHLVRCRFFSMRHNISV